MIIQRLKLLPMSSKMFLFIKYVLLSGCFQSSHITNGQGALGAKIWKISKIIIKSKLQRSELNNSGRLEVDPMQVCLPKFWKAQSSGSKTNEEKKMTNFCVPSLTLGISLKYP